MTTRHHSRRSLVRAAAMGLSLLTVGAAIAGCGSGSGSNGPVAIEYWHRLPEIQGARSVTDLVNTYNAEHPGTTVTATTMQGSAPDSYPKIASAVQSGSAPCLAQVGADRAPDLLSSGQLLDVTDVASKYADQYLPAAWRNATFDGRTYGLPQDTGPSMLFYRKDLFDQLGLQAPTTWDEYRVAAAKIRTSLPGVTPGNFGPEANPMESLAASNGATWWSMRGDGWTVDIDSPQTKVVTDYWQNLISTGLVSVLKEDDPALKQQLANGQMATMVKGSWFAPLLAEYAPASAGKWAVAQLPSFTPGQGAVGQEGGSIVAVLAGCQHPAEAVDFANWFNAQTPELQALGLMPATARQSVTTPPALATYFGGQPIFDQFVAANNRAPAQFSYAPAMNETVNALQDGMAKAATSPTALATAITTAQQTSVASLQRAGIPVVE